MDRELEEFTSLDVASGTKQASLTISVQCNGVQYSQNITRDAFEVLDLARRLKVLSPPSPIDNYTNTFRLTSIANQQIPD
jgi:hypothetical protein